MQRTSETLFNTEDFVPELRQILTQPPFDPRKRLSLAIPINNPSVTGGRFEPKGGPRQKMVFTDGKEFWNWELGSLRTLFRGNRQPPVLGDYPEAYGDSFMLFDLHVLEISKFLGDLRDAEMKEIFSTLRRRPDGRSLGFVHDYLWQAAALVLGTRPLSQAEFEAIMARLERSCRTFEEGPTSRNFVAAIESTYASATGH